MTNRNSNNINIPEAREAMDKFKMEAASEVGVNLKNGYNGDLTSREAGSVGGQMVKKMIEAYERSPCKLVVCISFKIRCYFCSCWSS